MVDHESEIFTRVATVVRAAISGITCLPETPSDLTTFPCLVLQQMDLSEFNAGRNLTVGMNFAESMFQADVYSNLQSGRKAQCKQILTSVTNEMIAAGYTLISMIPETPPAREGSLRYTARYSIITA